MDGVSFGGLLCLKGRVFVAGVRIGVHIGRLPCQWGGKTFVDGVSIVIL